MAGICYLFRFFVWNRRLSGSVMFNLARLNLVLCINLLHWMLIGTISVKYQRMGIFNFQFPASVQNRKNRQKSTMRNVDSWLSQIISAFNHRRLWFDFLYSLLVVLVSRWCWRRSFPIQRVIFERVVRVVMCVVRLRSISIGFIRNSCCHQRRRRNERWKLNFLSSLNNAIVYMKCACLYFRGSTSSVVFFDTASGEISKRFSSDFMIFSKIDREMRSK